MSHDSSYKNKAINFIYFDVGGVVILDFSKTDKWNEMLDDLNLSGSQRQDFEKMFDEYEPAICNGMKVSVFMEMVKKKLDIDFPENYSMLRDFVNRFEVNQSIHPIINEAKKKYKIGLLTNMYPNMLDLIESSGLMPDIEWDIVIDSSLVGISKPNEGIYELAEGLAATPPERIAFVENTGENIKGAEKRGWKTILYDPSNLSESNNLLEKTI